MGLKFTKMHGCGNDYIYFNCFETPVEHPEALAVRISDRHFGVGGDGIVLICPSDKADAKCGCSTSTAVKGRCAETPSAASENICTITVSNAVVR